MSQPSRHRMLQLTPVRFPFGRFAWRTALPTDQCTAARAARTEHVPSIDAANALDAISQTHAFRLLMRRKRRTKVK